MNKLPAYELIGRYFYENGDVKSTSVKTISHSDVDLPELLTLFEEFLRAQGFHFKGCLDIVNPDDVFNVDGLE